MKALTTAEATIAELAARVERLEQHERAHCASCIARRQAIVDSERQAEALEAEAARLRAFAESIRRDPLAVVTPVPPR